MELDDKGIATGDTKDDQKQRKQLIVDFYGKWKMAEQTRVVSYSYNQP
ncbi:MAG: hypothetical protein LBL94_10600 [Prevotellaceae bacterium]|jgi:hypothetical protein|nr:hypothetical protein [Prevotellaceae bacterium]